MIAGLVQYSPVWEDKEANKNKIEKILSESGNGYDILVFPEMTLTGFSMNPAKFAEEKDNESFAFFSRLAVKYNSYIVYGFIENENGNYFNCLCVLDCKGNVLGYYRKIHLFAFAGEDKNYLAGSNLLQLEIDNIKIGFSICYDLRFPELFRQHTKTGTGCLVNIANWPVPRVHHWEALNIARAIENLSYIVSVNRTGNDPRTSYNGSSMVIAPGGGIVLKSTEEDVILRADINPQVIIDTRNQFRFLNDIKLI